MSHCYIYQMIEIYSWSLWEFPFLSDLPSQLEWGGIQYQGREASGPCVSTVAFAVMYFVLSKPQMLVHTCSCGVVAYSQLHSFLSSVSQLLLHPIWAPENGRWPLCLHCGSVPGSSLPLGSFWTHVKLFCCSHPHAGVHGNCVGFLQSSCPALPIAFSFLKEMIQICCFPGST